MSEGSDICGSFQIGRDSVRILVEIFAVTPPLLPKRERLEFCKPCITESRAL
jgi:hypothetical protein